MHRRRKREKTESILDVKCGLNASVTVFVCLCRVIHLFSIWKYLTLLNLSLLKVINKYNLIGFNVGVIALVSSHIK